MGEAKAEPKSCKTCYWCSKAGYCVEGGKAPVRCKNVCDNYKPYASILKK